MGRGQKLTERRKRKGFIRRNRHTKCVQLHSTSTSLTVHLFRLCVCLFFWRRCKHLLRTRRSSMVSPANSGLCGWRPPERPISIWNAFITYSVCMFVSEPNLHTSLEDGSRRNGGILHKGHILSLVRRRRGTLARMTLRFSTRNMEWGVS